MARCPKGMRPETKNDQGKDPIGGPETIETEMENEPENKDKTVPETDADPDEEHR